MKRLAGPVARIDLRALVHNFREVERLVGPAVAVLAMIKADAYGHGAVECGSALARAGCRAFGFATVAEAATLRAARSMPSDVRLLVLGGIAPSEAERAVAVDCEVATHDLDVVRALGAAALAAGREIAVHVKVDTGMHRLGVAPGDAAAFVDAVRATRGVRLAALCSHFAMAESVTTDVTAGQLDRLLAAARAVAPSAARPATASAAAGGGGARAVVASSASHPPVRGLALHLANSAAILTRPDAHLDMVRPGLMLYGLYPDPQLRDRARLRPVMTFAAPIVRVAEVAGGEGIGYGHTHRTKARARIATLRCGYADGYPRALSNRGTVVIGDARAPVVGRVGMDHTMIDVTAAAFDGVRSGDTALLWGAPPAPGAEDAAAAAETISYELVARVGPRVVREHVGA